MLLLPTNGENDIKKCLDSLLKSKFPVTIYIVDNASTDQTLDIIQKEYSMVMLVKNKENIGFGQANNIGFEYAKNNNFDYVLMLNQDTYIEEDTILKLVWTQNIYSEYDLLSPMHYSYNEENLDSNFYKYINIGCQKYIKDLITNKK